MTEKETSIFSKKYKQILKLKLQVLKKSTTNERYNNDKMIENNNNTNKENNIKK